MVDFPLPKYQIVFDSLFSRHFQPVSGPSPPAAPSRPVQLGTFRIWNLGNVSSESLNMSDAAVACTYVHAMQCVWDYDIFLWNHMESIFIYIYHHLSIFHSWHGPPVETSGASGVAASKAFPQSWQPSEVTSACHRFWMVLDYC